MIYKHLFALAAALMLVGNSYAGNGNPEGYIFGQSITWDSLSLITDGRRVTPVMGEVHYSRVAERYWDRDLQRMKEGGVTLVATYCFWNHIEEVEGQFDWSGQRNLRKFLEACKKHDLPVILRIGPFCHGEARNGGIPDWMFDKGCKMRNENPVFMGYVKRLYQEIFKQVEGLQWKDGGPLVAVQFDNEYRGRGSYLMALKKIAEEIGFDLPFYTRTGWPKLASPVPFGEILPLYGDYSDGFWDREITEGCGKYFEAFHFKPYRVPTATATEQLGKQEANAGKGDEDYPFFTCEQGGGMATSYHRRIFIEPIDVYASAIVKLGCGSNLLGYYMYRGGTNPEGKLTTLNENQRTKATNYNDMPVKTYDFQAPLGEFGQRNPSYYAIRPIHLFLKDFGEALAAMPAYYPQKDKPVKKGDDSFLRWTYRTDGKSAFVFVNNYERFANLTAKSGVTFNVGGQQFPASPITVPAGASFYFPLKLQLGDVCIDYATAQPVAMRGGNLYLMAVDGIPVELCIAGKVMKNLKPKGSKKAIYKTRNNKIFLLSKGDAERLFLDKEEPSTATDAKFTKVTDCKGLRQITIGVQKVAEEPQDSDFNDAAVYTIELPTDKQGALLDIAYRGDVARLYANGKFIDDNFYNGRHFQYDLSLLPDDCKKLTLKILPLQRNAPIYIPRQAKIDFGSKQAVESVEAVKIWRR